MPTSTSIEYAAQTDIGLKRVHNEDAIAICAEHAMVILADGMGGYNAGEVASEMALTVIRDYIDAKLNRFLVQLLPYKLHDLQQLIVEAIELANATILHAAYSEAQYFGMGTTLVMGLCDRDNLLIAHVGDSRAYRLRQGTFAQITHDHSVVQEQIDAGMISAESALTSDIKNLVTRAVGVLIPVEVEINCHKIQTGDLYLLCSDGLTDMVSDRQIQETLSKKQFSMQDMCAELIMLANEAGGRDNISVILFRVS